MAITRFIIVAACVLSAFAARAQDAAKLPPAVPDVVYKGVVGKALDAVPMDPEKRVVLQRTNAIVSSIFTSRSLAVWAGLSNPVLLAVGVTWGIYSAMNIKAAEINTKPDAIRVEPDSNQAVSQVPRRPAGMDTETAQCSPDTDATDFVAVAAADSVSAPPAWVPVADSAFVRF